MKKKLGEFESNRTLAKVYKLTGRDFEGDLYHVKVFIDGKHHEDSDYFTNDDDDAHSTAFHLCKTTVTSGLY